MNVVLGFIREPASIHYRPYLETLGKESVLSWWIRRLLGTFPDVELSLIVPTAARIDGIRRAAEHTPVRIHASPHGSEVRSLADVATTLGVRRIVLATLGMAFAPHDLPVLMLSHHLQFSNDYTTATGLPDGCSPEIIETELLCSLASLPLTALHTNSLRSGIRAIEAAIASSGDTSPFSLRHTEFDAKSTYQLYLAKLSRTVNITKPEDVEVAREVWRSLGTTKGAPERESASDPAEVLYLWKQHSATLASMRRSALIAAAVPSRPVTNASRPARVLYVSNSSGISGAEECLCRAVSCIPSERFIQTALVALPGLFGDRLRLAGVGVTYALREIVSPTVSNYLYVARIIGELAPDIIHFNGLVGLPATLAAVLNGIPFIQHARIADVKGCEQQLEYAARIIAVSRFVANELKRLDIDPDRVEVVYDGLEPNEFCRAAWDKQKARQRYQLPSEARIVLMVARYVRQKHHDLLIQAVNLVRHRIPNLHLVFVGDGQEDPHLFDDVHRFVQESDLGARTSFLGFQNDIREVQAASDVLVLCSEGEAFGTCVLEAMAMELPVIVTDSGGASEVIVDGRSGYIVRVGSAQPLAEKISEVLESPIAAQRVGRAARHYVESHLTASGTASRMMDIYDAVLAHAGTLSGVR